MLLCFPNLQTYVSYGKLTEIGLLAWGKKKDSFGTHSFYFIPREFSFMTELTILMICGRNWLRCILISARMLVVFRFSTDLFIIRYSYHLKVWECGFHLHIEWDTCNASNDWTNLRAYRMRRDHPKVIYWRFVGLISRASKLSGSRLFREAGWLLNELSWMTFSEELKRILSWKGIYFLTITRI